jgi:hypothetical protein
VSGVRAARAVAVAVVIALVGMSVALAHEERLVRGRVRQIDAPKSLLVVEDPERERSVRLTIDADTEVRRCRAALGLAALAPGDRVRVKYVDDGRGLATRGRDLEILSVLVLERKP